MKKLFTLLMAATLSLGSYAKDYTNELVVDVTGLPKTTTTSTISVNAQDNGKYTFLLKDFFFSGMNIGDINLTDVEGNTVNGTTYLRTAQPVNINLLGTSLSLPIILRAEIAKGKLKADMDIAGMPSMAIHVTFAGGGDLGGFQIPNSGFEDYYTYPNNIQEPLYWHSFASAGGTYTEGIWASLAKIKDTKHTESSKEVRPGSTGKSSLKVTSTTVPILNIPANGTITTGRMNAGSATPSDPANHAQIDMSNTDKDGHGDPYYVVLNGQPDSLAVWLAFKQGTPNKDYPYATVSAITTDGTYYQDPEDKDKTYNNKRAVAKDAKIATTFSGNTLTWKEVKIPFTEINKGITPKTILVTMSTNATPGKGSGSDELYIDDLSLIYNLPTVSISFKDNAVEFDKSNTATVNATGTVSADDFKVETEGALDGHVFKYINTVKGSDGNDVPRVTIIVTSGDYKKLSTYTVTLPGATTTGIRSVATDDSNGKAELYNLAGQRINAAQPGQVVIVKKGGKAVKVMK